MQDGNEAVDRALAMEPGVPRLDRRHDLLEEAAVRVGLVQGANGGGEHRRLRDAARRNVGRAVALGATPRAPAPGL